jgi:hypothetical protein
MLAHRGDRVRLDRTTDVEDVVVADQLRELRRGLTDGRLRRSVEDQSERPLLRVLHDQDHRPVEVVRHARGGDQQLAVEALAHALPQ